MSDFKPGTGRGRHRPTRALLPLLYVLALLLGAILAWALWTRSRRVEVLPYSEFQKELREGRISEVEITGNQISGQFRAPAPGGKRYFETARVDPGLAAQLDRYGVRFSRRIQTHTLSTVLSWLLPVALFAAFWFWVLRRVGGNGGGGFLSIGKSKAKVYVQTDTKTTFDDAAGVDEAVAELRESVDFLKDPRGYGRLGGRMPKGVLLVGPPGTGKTLLAKAVAGEAGVPFFSINGSEFVELFVGVGAARVRDLFVRARRMAPCIVFIDELDALGRARAAVPLSGGHDEKEQTLNQLLVELDGFDSGQGLILLAATNRPEVLDPALLRAGRFDRQILVDRPDKVGRLAVLRIYASKVVVGGSVPLEDVAAMTPGFTGADLANLVNEAALTATRRGRSSISMEDFTAAIERLIAGMEKKTRVLSPREREVVACHEMGHALVAASLPGSDPVHKVSIIPRGVAALGYTMQRPTEDRFLMTQRELEDKMAMLLGGRAAEQLTFSGVSTGAHDDLGKATDIARHMATRYGMLPDLGPVSYDKEPSSFVGAAGPEAPRYSEATAARIDAAVRQTVQEAFGRARAILERNRSILAAASRDLLAKETLARADLDVFFGQLRPEDGGAVGRAPEPGAGPAAPAPLPSGSR